MTTLTLAVFLLGIAVIVVAAVFVAAPLFNPPAPMAPAETPSERDRWLRQKRQAMAAIKDLELDYQMGKLSDEDLGMLRGRFEAQALEAMAALDKEER